VKDLVVGYVGADSPFADYLGLLEEAIPGLNIGRYATWNFDVAADDDPNWFWADVSADGQIADQDTFKKAIGKFLVPVAPLLRAILLDQDVAVLDIVTLPGYNGYEYGFIPLLEGLGFTDGLLSKAAISVLNDEAFVNALLAPLFNSLAGIVADPVTELLARLPQILYFVTSGTALKDSVQNLVKAPLVWADTIRPLFSVSLSIDQYLSLNGLLSIAKEALADTAVAGIDVTSFLSEDLIRSFIAGTLTETPSLSTLATVPGVAAEKYPAVESEPVTTFLYLLVQIVALAQENPDLLSVIPADFAGPVDVALNILKDTPELLLKVLHGFIYPRIGNPNEIDYTDLKAAAAADGTGINNDDTGIYSEWYTHAHAEYVYDRSEDFINKLWQILFGKPFGAVTVTVDAITGKPIESIEKNTFLSDLLGEALFTQANFDAIVQLAQTNLPALLTDTKIGDQSLLDFLGENVYTINTAGQTVAIDFAGIVGTFLDYAPGTLNAQGKDNFRAALLDLLEPAVPVLDILLAGSNLQILKPANGDEPGVFKALGADGYANALVPILEAFVVPLDTARLSEIVAPADFAQLGGRAKLEAILDPILNTVQAVADDPIQNLLTLLPTLLAFAESSLLDQCISNLLLPVNTVIKNVNDLYPSLQPLTVEINLAKIIDSTLTGTGLNIDYSTLKRLIFGTVTEYPSKGFVQNGKGYFVQVDDDNRADMITVALQLVLITVAFTEQNKQLVLEALADYGLRGAAYEIVCQNIDDIFVLLQTGDTSQLTGNYVFGANIALNAVFVLLYGTDQVICAVYDTWGTINAEIRAAYQSLLEGSRYNAAFAKNANAFANRYFQTILTPDVGLAQNGFLSFFKSIFAWIKKFFSYIF
jgi:hypothetical protein